ncbi:hypothetical protein HDU78_010269 [Chytriomyces hyalinus]|nr:hypothetical protein HDU78_010269 [Chytriomyces hyalinus]
MLQRPTVAKIMSAKGSATATTTPTQVMQAKSEAVLTRVAIKEGFCNIGRFSTSSPSSQLDNSPSQIAIVPLKEEMADGWRKGQAALNVGMDVECTVEQCKAKVMALRSLWSKVKAEEGETGNLERRMKKPDSSFLGASQD